MIPIFRVWHKKEKKMKEVYEITFHKDSIIVTVLTGEYTGFTPILMALRVPEDADLIQSIGLKDKTEKEIFDGDIIETYGGKEAEVKFGDAMFYLEFKDKSVCDCASYDGEMTIIGNIRENPELFEGLKK